MDDKRLDDLLDRAGTTGDGGGRLEAAISDLVDSTRRQPQKVRRSLRAPLIVGGSLAAVITGGLLAQDAWKQEAPYQELPDGWVRTTEPIPLDWVSASGEAHHCRIFLDFEQADRNDVERLDAAILVRDWEGFGQSIYDAIEPVPVNEEEAETEVSTRTTQPVSEFAESVIRDDATVGAIAITCRAEQQ